MARFAVIGPDGELEGVESDMHSAVERAGSLATRVEVEGGDESHLNGFGEFGALDPTRLPDVAMKNSGLSEIDLGRVMEMSLAQAHAKLVPFFPSTRTRKSGEVVSVNSYKTPLAMVDALLGQNYKTAKETPEDPTDVQGLSLLPYSMGKSLSGRALPMRGLGFCVGSSESCRRACLVNSGHNVIDVYNQVVKLSKTEAISLEPEAFARILVEACRKHFHPARGNVGYEPLIRLNVFSDLPWELLFPGLFEMFPTEQFYDYTKVPGRVTPSNYDLTFSWSGSNENYVHYEVERGRRIAVVFMVGFKKTGRGENTLRVGLPLPQSFLGLQVVDGDISDVRPRDPAPGVVGLRWKRHGLGKKHDIKTDEHTAFVVPVKEVDGQLVAAESSRQSPIVDADSEGD